MYARVIDSSRCFECSAPAEVEHHVVPRSRGGTMTVPLCGRCHGRAHHTKRNMAPGHLIKEAQARLRAEGKHVGAIPYGYQIGPDGRLEPRPDQQEILRRIASLREKMTWSKIAATLNAEGVPTGRGGEWADGQLRSLISCRRGDPVRRGIGPSAAAAAEVVAQYSSGKAIRAVAAIVGVGTGTVRRALRDAGVPFKNRGGRKGSRNRVPQLTSVPPAAVQASSRESLPPEPNDREIAP